MIHVVRNGANDTYELHLERGGSKTVMSMSYDDWRALRDIFFVQTAVPTRCDEGFVYRASTFLMGVAVGVGIMYLLLAGR